MNHCFKSVLNLSSGTSQVTSEKTRNGGRTGSSVNKLALATLLGLSAGTATANIVIDSGMTQSVPSGMQFDAAGYLVVGGNTFGQLSIASGGEATNTDAYVGFSNGSQGEVFVSGTGAKWTTNGFLSIGFDGQAIVMVDDGASVIVRDGTDLAAGLNSFAQLTLSGTGNARGLFSTLTS